MRLGNPDVRIASAASLVTDHEREDARTVGLKGQAHQVVRHCQMFVKRVGNTARSRRATGDCIGASFHAVKLLFDIADDGQVFIEDCVIGRAEVPLQIRCFLGD